MKKVLVAAAGLMLVGTMASTAMAEFYFSGNARARFFLQNDYDEIAGKASDEDTEWNSRVRFNIKADTKGGAYAFVRMRANNGTWGTNAGDDLDYDRAYVGVPFGMVTMEAGRQNRDVTPWFLYGLTDDGVDFNYKQDATTLVGFYDMLDENVLSTDDDDEAAGGLVLVQEFEGGWALTAGAVYYYDDTLVDERDDFGATVNLAGALGTAAVQAEVSYAGEEFAVSNTGEDDGWGGQLTATLPLGSLDLTGIAGFTVDGFIYDGDDFGPFEMLGDVNWINTGLNPSAYGETILVALNPVFKASEKLTLGAVLAWANADGYAAGSEEYDMFEVSGRATYAVTDGANLIGVVGYLETDDATEDNPFGVGLGVELSF